MAADERGLIASTMKLAAYDVANGSGQATVILRSGATLQGTVNKSLSGRDALTLNTPKGWHVIDYTEIAALTGATV